MAGVCSKTDNKEIDFLMTCCLGDHSLQNPKLLPCQHSCCKDCIQAKIGKEERDFVCPKCQLSIPLTEKDVDQLQENVLYQIIQETKGSDDCVTCQFGDKKTPGSFQCLDCSDVLCNECKGIHTKTSQTRFHRVVSVKDIQDGKYKSDIQPEKQMLCNTHSKPNKPIVLEYYCKQCKCLVCSVCLLEGHKGHDYKHMDGVKDEKTTTVTNHVTELMDLRKTVAEFAAVLGQELGQNKNLKEKLENEVHDRATQFIEIIEKVKDNTLRYIKCHFDKEDTSIQTTLCEAENRMIRIDSIVNYTQVFLKHSGKAQFLQHEHEVMKKLNEEKQQKMDTTLKTNILELGQPQFAETEAFIAEAFGKTETKKLECYTVRGVQHLLMEDPEVLFDEKLGRDIIADVGKRSSSSRGLGNNESTTKPRDQKPESETDDLFKKVKRILNKLTPQTFQTLVQRILDSNIDTEEKLKGTINLVFEKAIDEPNSSVAIANMCRCMISIKVPKERDPRDTISFRKLLLNRCQTEFEKDKDDEINSARRQTEIDNAPEDKKRQLAEEKALAEAKAKRRSLGNIRFIGELFRLKMLTAAIMHDCLLKLLKSSDEDSLECFCRLLTTIGKDLDSDRAKPRMDQYFNQIDKIIKQKKTSSRVRFMLRDVTDLRLSNWVPRRADYNPKIIDQIHKEVQKENQQRAIHLSTVTVPSGNWRDDSRGWRSGSHTPGDDGWQNVPSGNWRGDSREGRSGSHTPGDDGWQAVSSKTPINTLDPTKMRLTKNDVDAGIKIGPGGGPGGRPGGYPAWGRWSSVGNKPQNSADFERSTPANRFSALRAEETFVSRNRMGRSLAFGHDGKNVGQQLALGRGKQSGRFSHEADRDAALHAVRGIVGGKGSRTPGESREQSRDYQRELEAKRPTPDAKELSVPEIEKKTISIMGEYLHFQDFKEASECIQELQSPSMMHVVVSSGLNHVLERSSQARYHTGVLHKELVKLKLLSIESYSKGLGEVLEFAEDMEIDIPKIWQFLGELISPLIQERAVPLDILKNICKPLIASKKAGVLVAEVLHDASKRMGHIKIASLWKTSNLQWAEFLPENENVDEFIKKHKLEYTVGPEVTTSPDSKSMPTDQIQTGLNELIITKNATNEVVFDWIEEYVGEPECKDPSFIRALMTSVCSSAITGSGSNTMVDPTNIQARTILLQKFLDHKPLLELQALYALQALVHKLGHPPGVLRTFFDTLFDEDIISENAFNAWETTSDSAEQVGKAVAKASVVQFFKWLHGPEYDEL